MVLGTSSHVGKSLLTAALCRIFAQHGHRVAPFKAQNMSLNSAATLEGCEIGRAQALQAEAAGIAPSVDMNPILIKPSGKYSSQVVVRGKIWGRVTAADYHQRRVEELMPAVRESFEMLASKYEIIILEGAGSPAEINLKQHDIANMRMAEMADASCLLVGDIDRGGIFASLLGTLELLEPSERKRIQAFVINKFRGDRSLLEPGIRMIEDRVQKSCIGVVPYLGSLMLEEEDSLGLPTIVHGAWRTPGSSVDESRDRPLRIAVIALPSFSNFTDFDSLCAEPSVSLRFCHTADVIAEADVLILPGSKQTADDLLWMRSRHLDAAIYELARTSLVVGICGGMQMLGETILDPLQMEHDGTVRGLGLLPIETVMQAGKVTRIVCGELATPMLFGQEVTDKRLSGYEIHIGKTIYRLDAKSFATLSAPPTDDVSSDGCVSADSRIFGTYLHGLFDADAFRHQFLHAARKFHQLAPPVDLCLWKQLREASLDRLAREVEDTLDMKTIFGWAGLSYRGHSPVNESIDNLQSAQG
jgi:adenosylcobyric acid synthase